MIKLPTPRVVDERFYAVQGLYCDQEDGSWDTMWRLFKSSLYHLSLHAAFSDFSLYAPWAKGKDVPTATYAVSLVEDMHAITHAKSKWPGVLPDIAYANYVSSLRLGDPNKIDNPSLRFATKLLLGVSGVHRSTGKEAEEDKEVVSLAERIRLPIEEASSAKADERRKILVSAVHEVYSSVAAKGALRKVPFLPYTESHGDCDLFDGKLLENGINEERMLDAAYLNLGLKRDPAIAVGALEAESREVLTDLTISKAKLAKIKGFYEGLMGASSLEGIEFPAEDYATFMRVRSALAGPIKNIKDQLSLVKNVLDDTSGHDSGQQLDTQAAMQLMASGQTTRTDVFEQLQPMHKEEAWVVLLDSSKSVSTFSHEVKGIATCLAEVLKGLIKNPKYWAMYSFNNSFQVIKDFEESYSMSVKARIGGLTQRNTTLLPDALSVAYKTLAAKDASARILVVVSDGYPSGYNGIDKKLISTIKEVSKSGVLLLGVGVDSGAIKEYFAVNCVLSTPYEMMKSFAKAYFELSYLF